MIYLNKKRGVLSLFLIFLIINMSFVYSAEESYVKVNNQLIAKSDSSKQDKISFYQLDFMGNVRTEFTNDAAERVIDYMPFGKAISISLSKNIGYRSSVYDKDTNLYSTYDTETARYNVPSAVVDQFDSQSLNPYSFRKNNPFRDITSEQIIPDLTIPERQDGVEGASVESDQTLSQKWEKQVYLPKITYGLIKSIVKGFETLLSLIPSSVKIVIPPPQEIKRHGEVEIGEITVSRGRTGEVTAGGYTVTASEYTVHGVLVEVEEILVTTSQYTTSPIEHTAMVGVNAQFIGGIPSRAIIEIIPKDTPFTPLFQLRYDIQKIISTNPTYKIK